MCVRVCVINSHIVHYSVVIATLDFEVFVSQEQTDNDNWLDTSGCGTCGVRQAVGDNWRKHGWLETPGLSHSDYVKGSALFDSPAEECTVRPTEHVS